MINRTVIGVSRWVRDELTSNGLDRATAIAKFKQAGIKCSDETLSRTIRRIYNELTGTCNRPRIRPQGPDLYNREIVDGNILVIGDTHCLPLDTTEVLTRNGWINLADVEIGQEIMTSDEKLGLKFDTILQKVTPRMEDVYKFKRNSVKLETTSEHNNFIYRHRYKKLKTKDLINAKAGTQLVSNGYYKEGKDNIEESIAKLIGFCLGDGTRCETLWKISVKKPRKIEYLDTFFKLGFITRCPQKTPGYVVYRVKQPYNTIIDKYLQPNKSLNMSEVLNLTYTNLTDILEGVIESDGGRKKTRPNISITSIRAESLKCIQLLAHITGNNCTWGVTQSNKESTFPSDNPLFVVTLSKRKYNTYCGNYTNETRKTIVGCVTVKTGLILVKQNNNIFITGNCPFQHPDYLGFCQRIYKEHNCKAAVHIGDLCDMHSISYHETNPDGMSAGDEFQRAHDEVQRWVKAFPTMRICIGNHDALPLRKARTHGLPTSLFKTYSELWGTPKAWLWRFTHEINGVLFQHGTNCSGQQAHINQARKNRQSTVIGHCHTLLGVEYDASKRDLIFGLAVGCGLSPSSYAFEYAMEAPKRQILGCGVVLDGGKQAIAIPMVL